MTRRLSHWILFASVLLAPALAFAGKKNGAVDDLNAATGGDASFANRPLVLMIALGALGFAPFVLMMVTSFV